jgi:6-phosphogluconate dehydrogenase
MKAKARIHLIERCCQWVFDNSDGFETDHIGEGLAYLVWAIVCDDGQPLDTTLSFKYDALVRILRTNPNGLLRSLIKHHFIIVEA